LIVRIYSQISVAIAAIFLCLFTISASAQDATLAKDLSEKDDRGFIVGLLEDALGGEGRIVRVDGFAGALSKTATIQSMTIADEVGVWLTLNDVQLRWNRSALLRGRIEVEELSAASLDLARAPIAPKDEMPSAEATGFSLPNLPVSVVIDQLKIDSITLGETILGEPAEMSLQANARLENGSGNVELTANRIDAIQGQFLVKASYEATEQAVDIDIDLIEPEGGIAARLLNLPQKPSLRLQVSGAGTLDDLTTDISLATNDIERLQGEVILRGNATEGRAFDVDLGGDLTPLMTAEYHNFFGTNSTLRATAQQTPDGGLELSKLDLRTKAIALQGDAALDSTYAPLRLALTGKIQPATSGPVVLPFGGGNTSIEQANLNIAYDATVSDIVDANFDVLRLKTDGVAIEETQLSVRGTLASALQPDTDIQADVTFAAVGVDFDDPSLQDAVGLQIKGTLQIEYEPSGQLRIGDIDISGTDYEMTGAFLANGLTEGFKTDIDVVLRANQLSQFSKLASTDLGGKAVLSIVGDADLGGAFDLRITGSTTDVSVGIAQADQALAGFTKLDIEVIRDATGTRLPRLDIQNPQLRTSGSAVLKTDASEAEFNVTLANSAQIDPRLQGPVTVSGRAKQDIVGWTVDTTMRGPFNATTTLAGRATGPNPSLRFGVQLPDVSPLVPQFRGSASVQGTAKRAGDVWRVDTDITGPYGITGAVAGSVTGTAPNINYQLRIPNLAALGAQIDGPLVLEGTAAQQGSQWRINTDLTGLSGTRAQLSGVVSSNGTVNLATTGVAPLALANPFIAPRNIQGLANFDLALRGRPALTSLSGTINTANARLSAPTLRLGIENLAAQIALQNGRARINATGAVSSGGQIAVRGPLNLTGGLNADLAITLNAVRVVDPSLYDTRVNGDLSINGPLTGGAQIAGRLTLSETNIRVPESTSAGFTIVPQISHRNPTRAVRTTLDRAGFGTQPDSAESRKNGPSYPLDIRISAPSQIFVRGRGIDAELGGGLRIRGRSDQVLSSGSFSLIRGRVDILGKRFELDEGRVELRGSLDPYLRFVATTRTSVGTASIIIEGPASQPQVTFSSNPEAPQDEVLAQIFFGRDASTLSAFQAIQLASAVATLAGKGGESVVSKLRKGFGLNDFDVTTDAEGNTGLRLGKYLSDNIYTDVTLGNGDTAGVSINIDLTESITARGQLKSNGDSSVGIFFEKEY